MEENGEEVLEPQDMELPAKKLLDIAYNNSFLLKSLRRTLHTKVRLTLEESQNTDKKKWIM